MKQEKLVAKIEDAIANTKGLASWTFVHEKCRELLEDVLKYIEAQPFDVLHHLRDGGELICYEGDLIEYKDGLLRGVCGINNNIQAGVLIDPHGKWDWQPYHKPPAPRKPGWYWTRRNYDSGLSVWYFNDKKFHTTDNVNDEDYAWLDKEHFHWIGDTRIEPEQPK